MAENTERRPYDEEYDAVEAFCDKYESLIKDAPENSLLGMIRDLDNAMMGIAGHQMDVDHLMTEDDENLKTSEACITHVMLILAQMWSDENQDIELVCTDPATGEEVVVEGTPSEEYLRS